METKVRRYICNALLTVVALFVAYSCSDDKILRNGINSTLEETADFKRSSFLLEKNFWELTAEDTKIVVELRSHTYGSVQQFQVDVAQEDGKHRITMNIPKGEQVADGDYEVEAFSLKGTKFGKRLIATFKDEMLCAKKSSADFYKPHLRGEGTAESPLKLSSSDDFQWLLLGLSNDSVGHGAGLYFKQMRSFDAPPESDAYTGHNYAGYSFAGIYDGNNEEINLAYAGSKTEENVGLFKILYEGAEIKNLTINANIRRVGKNGGALAGRSEGKVTIKNVTVKGSLTDCNDNIGGFIGMANGDLNVNNSRILASVDGHEAIGGLVGYYTGGKLSVDTFTNVKPNSSIGVLGLTASGNRLGGVAGALIAGSCDIQNVLISHPISIDDINIPVMRCDGNDAGGVIGKAELNGTSRFDSVRVVAPIQADGYCVGGLIGSAKFSNNMEVRNCQFNSYLKGKEDVGGFIGKYFKGGGKLSLVGGNSIMKGKEGSYLSIEGSKYVGGVIGWVLDNVEISGVCEVNAPVIAYDNYAGGIAGGVSDVEISNLKNFVLSSYMTVYSSDAAGGLVGYADGCTLIGDLGTLDMDPKSMYDRSYYKKHSNFGGTVKCDIPGRGAGKGTSMGGIVGYGLNCSVKGVCFSGTVEGKERVGGIVGHANFNENKSQEITNCVNAGVLVENKSSQHTGGVIGLLEYKHGTVSNLINQCEIRGMSNTGGVIGTARMLDNADVMKLELLVNEGTITGQTNVGGCIGQVCGETTNDSKHYDNQIRNCGNYGNVTCSGYDSSVDDTNHAHVGGILGRGSISYAKIVSCANHGAIKGYSEHDSDVGGICGRFGYPTSGVSVSTNTELAYCCNKGEIYGGGHNSYVGGILGRAAVMKLSNDPDWIIHDIYNTGKIATDHKDDTGGLVGFGDYYSDVKRGINTGFVESGNGCVGTHRGTLYHNDLYYLSGTGKSWSGEKFDSNDKKTASTFHNFDFTNVWLIDSDDSHNGGYPYLRNCKYQEAIKYKN